MGLSIKKVLKFKCRNEIVTLFLVCMRQQLSVDMTECDKVGPKWHLAPKPDSLVADVEPQFHPASIKKILSAHTSKMWAHALRQSKTQGKVAT